MSSESVALLMMYSAPVRNQVRQAFADCLLSAFHKAGDSKLTADDVICWIGGGIPTDKEKGRVALRVCLELGLTQVVENMVRNGPEICFLEKFACEGINGADAVKAWSRGYRVEFDGVVDFPVDPDILGRAAQAGMPVKILHATPGIGDRQIHHIHDLEVLIAPNNPDVTVCPPTVKKLDARGSCGISDLSGVTELLELDTRDNHKIRSVPPTVQLLTA